MIYTGFGMNKAEAEKELVLEKDGKTVSLSPKAHRFYLLFLPLRRLRRRYRGMTLTRLKNGVSRRLSRFKGTCK